MILMMNTYTTLMNTNEHHYALGPHIQIGTWSAGCGSFFDNSIKLPVGAQVFN
jgi:hypothetical protein